MVQMPNRWSDFCRGRSSVRVRVRSPAHHQQYMKAYSPIKALEEAEFSGCSDISEVGFNGGDASKKPMNEYGNRVMVVVDSSFEGKGALQWALSHTVQSQDTLILLHVTSPIKGVNSNAGLDQKAYELLCSMKAMCQTRKPGVQVEFTMREGKEKGPTIVEEATQQKVSLLVLGQRKLSILWRLRLTWAGKKIQSKSGIVDYCIQNANCMTIAVRRNSRKYGGYLITTERHKDFWLLA